MSGAPKDGRQPCQSWQGMTMKAVRGSRRSTIEIEDSKSCSFSSVAGSEHADHAMANASSFASEMERRSWSRASAPGRIFLWWMFPLLWRGSHGGRPLQMEDFPITLMPPQYRPSWLADAARSALRGRRGGAPSSAATHAKGVDPSTAGDSGYWSRDGRVWVIAGNEVGGAGGTPSGRRSVGIHGKKDEKKNASVLMALVRKFWRPVLRSNILYIVTVSLQISLPLMMRSVLSAISFPYDTPRAYASAAVLLIVAVLAALSANHANLTTTLIGVNMQTSLMSLIMEKLLRTRVAALVAAADANEGGGERDHGRASNAGPASAAEEKVAFNNGDIINLVSNDTQRVQEFFVVAFHWMSPFLILTALGLLYSILGVASLVGFAVLFVSLGIVAVLAREIGRQRRMQMQHTDARVSAMSDVLVGIKAVKLYNWEQQFIRQICAIRKRETDCLTRLNFIQAAAASLLGMTPIVVSFVSFAVFSHLNPDDMRSDVIFPAIALFNYMQVPLVALPMFLASLIQVTIADARLSRFLGLDEDTGAALTEAPRARCRTAGRRGNVCIRGSFSWQRADTTVRPSPTASPSSAPRGRELRVSESGLAAGGQTFDEEARHVALTLGACSVPPSSTGGGGAAPPPFCLRNIELGFGAGDCGDKDAADESLDGKLVCVTGCTASGKTSLLMALLGELHVVGTSCDPATVCLSGRVAYVGHDSVILNASVRDNVLFGSDFDPSRYGRVMSVACLDEDVASMVDGDRTEIGERGINVSGGQKQRIAIARALYSSADIYLFDDPLSALDKRVAAHVFNEGIVKMLKRKTRLLVTGNPDCLLRSDRVLVMRSGEVVLNERTKILFAEPRIASMPRGDGDEDPAHGGVLDSASAVKRDRRHFASRLCNSDVAAAAFAANVKVEQGQQFRPSDDEGLYSVPTAALTGAQTRPLRGRSSGRAPLSLSEKGGPSTGKREGEESSNTRFTDDELVFAGRVKSSTYLHYMRQGAPLIVWVVILLMFVVVEGGNLLYNWWLTKWTDAVEDAQMAVAVGAGGGGAESVSSIDRHDYIGDRHHYLTVLLGIVLFSVVTGFLRTFGIAHIATRSAVNLHTRLVRSVMSSPLSFFHKTPMGRIVNRFTRDTDQIDMTLPNVGHGFLFSFFACAAVFVAISIFIPVFIAVAVPICCCYVVVAIFYSRSYREIVRIEALSRSPLFSLLSTTLTSPQTIRAFNRQAFFLNHFRRLVQQRQLLEVLKPACNAWLGISLELFSATVVGFTSFAVVFYRSHIDSGVAGIIMTYSLSLSSSLSVLMRGATGTEASMNSVERVHEYGNSIPSEFDGDDDKGDAWRDNTGAGGDAGESFRLDIVDLPPGGGGSGEPRTPSPPQTSAVDKRIGSIHFDNFSMRYRHDLPFVLKNLSFEISGGENVVVVGRTGSGKSSLVTAVFRLVDSESCTRGRIVIDGVDILGSGMSLHTLRRGLGIIPQEPILFSTTVRRNLDPFDEYDDAAIYRSLEICQIKDTVMENGGLHAMVGFGDHGDHGSGGAPAMDSPAQHQHAAHFSAGQAQLLCVARACLRQPRVLFADEATACVDSDTDAIIQSAIRRCFPETTIVTIAHRLEGILSAPVQQVDCAGGHRETGNGFVDRVIVMEDGKAAEVGAPDELLRRPDSRFSKMAARVLKVAERGAFHASDEGLPSGVADEPCREDNEDGDSSSGLGIFRPASIKRRDTGSQLRAQGRELASLASLSSVARMAPGKGA